jgi:1-acyl-sn-glycerol-3-phosphate acyltransferase
MIEVSYSGWADKILNIYLTRLIRSHFHSITLLGTHPPLDKDKPVLLIPNHSSWWDGFIIYKINKILWQRRLFIMMLEAQLSKNRFFARVGAYSIEPGRPKSVINSLRYTVKRLHSPLNPVVCMFPQGEMVPAHVRPVQFRRGTDWIQSQLQQPIQILLLGIKILHLKDQHPDVLCRFSSPFTASSDSPVPAKRLENELNNLLTTLDEETTGLNPDGAHIFTGKLSINERMAKLNPFPGVHVDRSRRKTKTMI